MAELLSISLALEQAACIRGESVYFEVVLENISKETVEDLPDFAPDNECVTLIVEGRDERLTAHQLSWQERDGVYDHGPEEPHTVNLVRGQKISLRDDLLSWFGELPAGNYKVSATYSGRLLDVASAPVELKVLAAAPWFASTPRYAAAGPSAPRTAAWVQKHGEGELLFYEQRSSTLPRNPRHGTRAVEIKKSKAPTDLFAATLPVGTVSEGHLLWFDDRDRLQFVAVDPQKPRLGMGVEVEVGFKGDLLHSPLSMPDGSLFVPMVDKKKQTVAILHVQSDGDAKSYELDLGEVKPLGPYSCFWEYDARLHFAWAAPRGREIMLGRLPLDDPASGFPRRSVYLSDAPILWIEAYLDTDVPTREAPYLEELIPPEQRDKVPPPPSPGVMLWCVTETPTGLACIRFNPAQGHSKVAATLNTGDVKGLRVIGSVVTYEYELVMLLADAQDQLYYASTIRGSVQPLAEAIGKVVTLQEFPGLIAASRFAQSPWVYLRYVKDKASIDYIRLEPADEKDPVERQEAAKPSRRRGR